MNMDTIKLDPHAGTDTLPSNNRVKAMAALTAGTALLTACAEPRPPVTTNTVTTSGTLDPRCGCMTGGTPPPVTTPPPTTPAAPLPAVVGNRHFRFVSSGSTIGVNMMGTETLSSGAAIQVWGFTDQSGTLPGFNADRVAPGPVIELTEGQLATITLSTGMPHTIHWHGLDVDQANDGVPATSGYVGNPPMMGNFGRVANYTSLGPSTTYQFVAPQAGTYMYHCHVDSVLHVELGMAGTVIVRPASGATNELWSGGPVIQQEYIWHLHTYDGSWHVGMPMNMVSGPSRARYQPDVFLINGYDGSKLLNDPATAITATAGESVAIRAVNIGYQPAVVSLAGTPFRVVASDGRPLPSELTVTEWRVMPGERYDIVFDMPTLAVATNARVDYYDIRNTRIIGAAVTQLSNV